MMLPPPDASIIIHYLFIYLYILKHEISTVLRGSHAKLCALIDVETPRLVKGDGIQAGLLELMSQLDNNKSSDIPIRIIKKAAHIISPHLASYFR